MNTFARIESARLCTCIKFRSSFTNANWAFHGITRPVYLLFIYLFTFFFQMGVVYTCTRITVNVSQSYFPFYLTETLHFQKVRWTEHLSYFFSLKLGSVNMNQRCSLLFESQRPLRQNPCQRSFSSRNLEMILLNDEKNRETWFSISVVAVSYATLYNKCFSVVFLLFTGSYCIFSPSHSDQRCLCKYHCQENQQESGYQGK